jgi:mevalonate kinase
MDGATALAIPTIYGQSLIVKPSEKQGIQWKSFDHQGKMWFKYDFPSLDYNITDANPIALKLLEILRVASQLNSSFLANTKGVEVSTQLDFPRDWGLGTSSTLINNIAQWAKVDAFKLLHKSFGGSGYDIAAAQNDSPILYRLEGGKPRMQSVTLDWNFSDSLFFIHLNKKQDSKEGIAHYKARNKNKARDSKIIQILNEQLLKATSLSSFETVLSKHEIAISVCIGIEPIKERVFPDYDGMIKSLGAWGGDFVLATGTVEQMDYFRRKGYSTIIPFAEMIK